MTINITNKATEIVEMFEDVLDKYNIYILSDEDDERGSDNEAKLYGTTYYDLIGNVESILTEILDDYKLEDGYKYDLEG